MSLAPRLTACLTGATDGIGRAAAKQLCALSVFKKLVIHGRNPEKAAAVAEECRAVMAAQAEEKRTELAVVIGDFSDLDSVVAVADQVEKVAPDLTLIINNAGILTNDFATTKQGFEATLGVNHIAPAVLTLKLLPLLERNGSASGARPSRVIMVGSMAHLYVGYSLSKRDEKTGEFFRSGAPITELPAAESKLNPQRPEEFDAYFAYGLSKLGNSAFAAELQRRLAVKYAGQQQPVLCASLHPGVIDTKLLSNLIAAGAPLTGREVETGTKSIVHLCTSNELAVGTSGGFWDDNAKLAKRNPICDKEAETKRFWQLTVGKWAAKYVDDRYKTENGL